MILRDLVIVEFFKPVIVFFRRVVGLALFALIVYGLFHIGGR